MSGSKGPWIEIWEECDQCDGTGIYPKAGGQKDNACPKCHQYEGPRKGKIRKMITFPEFHDIMHRG